MNLDLYRKFKKIYVTGPQRSGTTFAAKALASSLDYKHVDERDFGTQDINKMRDLTSKFDGFVVQCPCLFHQATEFDSDGLVVCMIRDINDIVKSEKRINFHEFRGFQGEHDKYIKNFSEYYDKNKPISQIKYDVWNNVQKQKIKNYVELDYNSLKTHPLWIDAENRKGFGPKQTQ